MLAKPTRNITDPTTMNGILNPPTYITVRFVMGCSYNDNINIIRPTYVTDFVHQFVVQLAEITV